MTAIDWSDLISDKCAKNPNELILTALADQKSGFPLQMGFNPVSDYKVEYDW